MSRRSLVILVVLLVAMPGVLYARWLKDKVYLQTEAVGAVEFSHDVHLEAVGRNCPTCHNQVYNIAVKRNPAFTMKEMEEGKACGVCHNGEMAFTVKENCVTCHKNGDMNYETDAGAVKFSHEVHTGLFGCDSCHAGIFKAARGVNAATMEQMEGGASCGACHDGSTAFSVKDEEHCASCHAM